MGFVIELANIITKRVEVEHLSDYAPEIFENDDWKNFCSGELDQSNKTNSKSLGGHTRQTEDDVFDDAPMDINMEKIMARFNTYSQQVSQSSSNNDDDEEDLDD